MDSRRIEVTTSTQSRRHKTTEIILYDYLFDNNAVLLSCLTVLDHLWYVTSLLAAVQPDVR